MVVFFCEFHVRSDYFVIVTAHDVAEKNIIGEIVKMALALLFSCSLVLALLLAFFAVLCRTRLQVHSVKVSLDKIENRVLTAAFSTGAM